MNIRKTRKEDVPVIMDLYENAKAFMRSKGNLTQWNDGYPSVEIITEDIDNGNSYVFVENDEIVGTFAFIIGEDPTYQVIEDGEWNSRKIYGTIHRIASSGKAKGLAKTCFDYCSEKIDYLRIDTHEDTQPMQDAVLRYEFKKCGIIYVRDGSKRVAFDYIKG